ncbi:TrkA C-terminal domain-containing protein, partial [Klebsiella pneumoniae]
IILVVGRRAGVVNAAEAIGTELQSSEGMDIVVVTRDVTINSPAFIGKTVGEIKEAATADLRHGIYVTGIKRADKPLPLDPDTRIEPGDVVTLYGT